MDKKIALITGATSGIGKACADSFASNQYNLIITGRRSERLEQVKEELSTKHGISVMTLCFDVRSYDEVKQNLNSLPEEWKKVDVLINNAGLASGLSTIQNGDLEDWEKMIDTNVKGLLYVSKEIIPWMIDQQKGHIFNIGSIAGKETYMNGNVYCATKHAVDSLTKAMRMETVQYGIKVTGICPGAVETEFSVVRFHGDKDKADQVYKGYSPLTAQDIADCVWFAASRPAHVNINDMLVMPSAQANSYVFHKEA